jgi:hypothetical protein
LLLLRKRSIDATGVGSRIKRDWTMVAEAGKRSNSGWGSHFSKAILRLLTHHAPCWLGDKIIKSKPILSTINRTSFARAETPSGHKIILSD